MLTHLNLITDRTLEDVQRKNAKGTYNASDLNRVSEAVQILRPLFLQYGYDVGEPVPPRVWTVNEFPRYSETETFLAAVLAMDGHFRYSETVHELPRTMRKFNYVGANNIEKFLAAMPDTFDRMADAWFYADEAFCGEV